VHRLKYSPSDWTAFRALDEAETRLQELTRLGREAVACARDGLTSETLRPGPPR
jgi:hypothetical protein